MSAPTTMVLDEHRCIPNILAHSHPAQAAWHNIVPREHHIEEGYNQINPTLYDFPSVSIEHTPLEPS